MHDPRYFIKSKNPDVPIRENVLDPVGTYAILSIKVVEKPGRAQKKIQSGREVQPE